MNKITTFITKTVKYLDDIFDKYSPLDLFIFSVILLIIAYQLKSFFISRGMSKLVLNWLLP